jgi:KTSC domain-containing protein
MRRRHVESTAISSVGYDRRRRVLEVEFVEGGVYQYFGVPADVHAKFLVAESLGNYFTAHIRNDYTYRRV